MRAWTWKTVAKLTALICGILLLGYFFLTPMGALRLVMLRAGHPTIYHFEDPVPLGHVTLEPMENWIVTELGPFYWADYYGYC